MTECALELKNHRLITRKAFHMKISMEQNIKTYD